MEKESEIDMSEVALIGVMISYTYENINDFHKRYMQKTQELGLPMPLHSLRKLKKEILHLNAKLLLHSLSFMEQFTEEDTLNEKH